MSLAILDQGVFSVYNGLVNVLGINAFHPDASACLVSGGRLVAAVEEERFQRIKHFAGFPVESVRFCLKKAGIKLSDVALVALNSDPKKNLQRKVNYVLRTRPSFKFLFRRHQDKKIKNSIKSDLNSIFPDQTFTGKIFRVEHHVAHLASAYLTSPFQDAVAVSVDGFGDFSSTACGVGKGNTIEVTERVFFPDSLGIFYQAMTQFLGFRNYGEEFKVMGLSAYGSPSSVHSLELVINVSENGAFRLNKAYFLHSKGNFKNSWNKGFPAVSQLYSRNLEKLLGPARLPNEPLVQRHRDLAASVQVIYESFLLRKLRALYKSNPHRNLVLAGGCAMNSLANGKIIEKTPFKKVFVPPAPGDAGGAIGAALVAANLRIEMDHASLGPSFSTDEIKKTLDLKKSEFAFAGIRILKMADSIKLIKKTAEFLAAGKVVGWFQGGGEWGPRALGSRSILCDPRLKEAKKILNLKIKMRESFRPFAPSVMAERASEWFVGDMDAFMTRVCQVKNEKRSIVPAITHEDGSARVQLVNASHLPLFHSLIGEFFRMTAVPMLLNTSFNENEPIVSRPEEALSCFLRTKMDVLAMGDYIVIR